MCRMLAKVSLIEGTLREELVEGEHSLKQQSKSGCVPPGFPPGHADGCGLAFVEEEHVKVARRGSANAWDEGFTKLACTVKCRLAIAHNRKASPGLKSNLSAECAHPFSRDLNGMTLAFCHNGGVGALMEQANDQNRVDSDIFFESILGGVRELDFKSVRARVGHLAREYRSHPKGFTSLTAFLLSPTSVFAWRLFETGESGKKSSRGWYPDYYTLSLTQSREQVLIASEPTDKSRRWELLPNGRFLAIEMRGDKIDIQQGELDF